MSRSAVCYSRLSGLLLVFVWSASAQGGDWLRFRGPNGTGVSLDSQAMPVRWSDTENVQWKIALPGPGSSSPIVVGTRIFVTCWSGYGTDRNNPGDQSHLRRHLICVDRANGNTIWNKTVQPVLPEDDYGGMFAEHGYASHTPVSDGQRVYVFFGKTGVLAFDLEGNQLWQTSVGTESDPRGWGSASSPIVHDQMVIVTASAESEALVALDKTTGKQLWRKEASGFGSVWGTPVLAHVDDGRTDLVVGVPNEIWAFDPMTGKLRWYCEAMRTDSFCSSVITDRGIVYAIEGRGGGSIAVRTGGEGDVSDTHVVWSGRDSSRIGTPVLYDGRLYFFGNRIANCIDGLTGKKVYQERLKSTEVAQVGVRSHDRPNERDRGRRDDRNSDRNRGPNEARRADDSAGPERGPGGPGGRFGRGGRGPGGFGGGDYASPVFADGKIYFVTRSGETYVVAAGDQFEQLAANRVTKDVEDFSATPAISDGQLLIRSNKHLYCVSAIQP